MSSFPIGIEVSCFRMSDFDLESVHVISCYANNEIVIEARAGLGAGVAGAFPRGSEYKDVTRELTRIATLALENSTLKSHTYCTVLC